MGKDKAERKRIKAEKLEAKLQKKHQKLENAGKFKLWRNHRPFWGATLSVLAGLLILYIPIQLYAIAFVPGSFAFVGFLFGGLVLILGVLAYLYPQFSTVLGVIIMFLSILSIMGALGGFLFGTIFGIVGGALCIAWKEQEIPHLPDQSKESKESNHLIDHSEVASTKSTT
ncbi:DUF6114 domain-containing protein [Tuberibacillus calidus]|uniref:DUF6114 domain-containing protein n=1 Tax=Tuberibacillus calidus TaxID=340097 RepID=UPI0004209CD0|nr:DUF6114 domain-containing protein [Tuberibacillus calidus]